MFMYSTKTEKNNYGVVAGAVKSCKPFDKDGKSGVLIVFEDKTAGEVLIFFKDAEKTNFTNRFAKAGVKEGSKIACYVGAPNEKDGKTSYTGFDFSYAGKVFTLKGEDGAKNIFFGNIGEPREGSAGQIIVGGAVNAYDASSKEKTTEWINFSFWNNDGGAQNATNAKKILKKGDTVAFVYDEPTEFNDAKYAKVLRFTKIFD